MKHSPGRKERRRVQKEASDQIRNKKDRRKSGKVEKPSDHKVAVRKALKRGKNLKKRLKKIERQVKARKAARGEPVEKKGKK